MHDSTGAPAPKVWPCLAAPKSSRVGPKPSGSGLDFRLVQVLDECLAEPIHRFEDLIQEPGQSPNHASGIVMVEERGAQRMKLRMRIVAYRRRRDGLLVERTQRCVASLRVRLHRGFPVSAVEPGT